MEKQKVCIIGGGLTGLLTAVALSKLNLKIDLVTNNNKNIKSNRTTAISQDNYNYLRRLNIFKFSKKDFWPCLKMKLYTENESGNLDQVFYISDQKDKKIFYMFNNYKIKQGLINNIKKKNLIKLKLSNNIKEIISSGMLKSLRFKSSDYSKYNLIIDCSGNNSNLSKNYFSNNDVNRSYGEVSVTTIINHHYLQNNSAKQIFVDNGIMALLPISNTQTSIVWSIKKKLFKKYAKNKNQFLKEKIIIYAKNFYKKIKFNSILEIRDLNLIIRQKYYKDRVLLFGDALHVIHPFAGQGFNMIIRDLMSLQKIFESKINLGLDIGSADILSEFTYETKPRNFAYSIGLNMLKDSFSFENKSFKKIRNKVLENLNKNTAAKNLFYNIANKGLKF